MISETTNRILVIRLSSFGDIILTTPFIRSLKKFKPSAEIDYLVATQYSDLIRHNPNVNRVYEFDKSGPNRALLSNLKKNNYDLVIDLQNNLRSRRVTARLKTEVRRYKKPTLKKYLLVNFKWNMLEDSKPIPARYAEVLPELELDGDGPEFFMPDRNGSNTNNSLIGICPGSRHFSKMWPAEYFIRLGNLFTANGYKIFVLGGTDDKFICGKIAEAIPGARDESNNNDLFQTALKMSGCRLIICNDSGLMHLATALKVPVAAIFGSTVKEFGFFPYKSKSLVLENNSISCRPCTHIGRSNCPEEHFNCMKEITPEIVFENINKYLVNDE